MQKWKYKRLFLRFAAVSLCLVVIYLIALCDYNHQQKSLLSIRPTTRFLNGTSFARVHFRLYMGHILVTVHINGHAQECVLDTGATTTHVTHPDDISTEAFKAGLFRSIGPPVPGCAPRALGVMIIHSVQIGDYMVENVPVCSYKQLPSDPFSVRKPILGNDLFRNVAVTIDCRSATLLIALPSSDQAPSRTIGWDQTLEFQSNILPGPDNLVLLHGIVAHSPSLLVFDTGQFLEPLAVVDRTLAKRIAIETGVKSQDNVQLLENVSWSVAGTQFHTMVVIDTRFPKPFQALVGTPYLLLYRVGIDYPAHRLYLHRYRSTEPFTKDAQLERILYFSNEQRADGK